MLKFKYFICILMISVFISSYFFVSQEAYSINKPEVDLGETRSIGSLIMSNNRLELKNKIEFVIYNSHIRNKVLETIANVTWFLQKNSSLIDYQFFNTEIYFGKNGEVFPKYKTCGNYNIQNLNLDYENKLIFLLMPLKQEVETNKLHVYQGNQICDENRKEFTKFKNKYSSSDIFIIDTYQIFENKDYRYYEFGDTHWNDLGVKTIFLNILDITHSIPKTQLNPTGESLENNLILERLGLVKVSTTQTFYDIPFKTDKKIPVLIIHDSFFESSYVDKSFVSNYFDATYLSWAYFKDNTDFDLESLFKSFDFIIIESSIDSFFSDRIYIFK